MTEPLLLTTKQACAVLAVSDETLRGIVRSGSLRPVRLSKSSKAQLRFRRADLERFVEGLGES